MYNVSGGLVMYSAKQLSRTFFSFIVAAGLLVPSNSHAFLGIETLLGWWIKKDVEKYERIAKAAGKGIGEGAGIAVNNALAAANNNLGNGGQGQQMMNNIAPHKSKVAEYF